MKKSRTDPRQGIRLPRGFSARRALMKRKTSAAHDGLKPSQLVFVGAFLTCLCVAMPHGASPLGQSAAKSEPFQTFPVGTAPIAIALAHADIWVANLIDNTVTRLRYSDGSKLGTIAVGTRPMALCSNGSSIWVANSESKNVTKLRTSDGAVLGAFAVGTG